MIAITDKTFKLDKPALMDGHMNERKEKYIIVKTFKKTREVS